MLGWKCVPDNKVDFDFVLGADVAALVALIEELKQEILNLLGNADPSLLQELKK